MIDTKMTLALAGGALLLGYLGYLWSRIHQAGRFVRHVPPHEMAPSGYGLIYRDVCRNLSVCCPVPLNLVARLAWWLWWRIRVPNDTAIEKRIGVFLDQQYRLGFKDGHTCGGREGADVERARIEGILNAALPDGTSINLRPAELTTDLPPLGIIEAAPQQEGEAKHE